MTVEEREAWDKEVTQHNVSHVETLVSVQGIEEDDAPEGVQENGAEGLSGAGEEEYLRATQEAHRRWTNLKEIEQFFLLL